MRKLAVMLCVAAAGLAGPALSQETGDANSATARATLLNVDGDAVGTAEFIPTHVGVLIRADVEGMPPGAHGFHIHETGECSPPFDSAGGHYSTTEADHGFFVETGPHVGDMPNIHVPENGALTVEVMNPFIRLEPGDIFDEDGSALMIHSGPDDYMSQPSGDAGDRIACGVILPAE